MIAAPFRFMAKLPYPPSVNNYWKRGPRGMYLSELARAYRQRVIAIIGDPPCFSGKLAVAVVLSPPDRRKRDIDNVLKSLLDCLAHAGVYEDDSQIVELTIRRVDPEPPGDVLVMIDVFNE